VFGQNDEEFFFGGRNFDVMYSYAQPEIVRKQSTDTGTVTWQQYSDSSQRLGPSNDWTSNVSQITGYPTLKDLDADTNSWTFTNFKHWGINPGFNSGHGPENLGAFWSRGDGIPYANTETAIRLSKLDGIANTNYLPDGYYDGTSGNYEFVDGYVYLLVSGQVQSVFLRSSVTNVEACLIDNQSVDVTVTGSGPRYWNFDGNAFGNPTTNITFGMKEDASVTFKNVPSSHPLAFHTKTSGGTSFATVTGTVLEGTKTGLDGNSYSFYSGDVTLEITSSSIWNASSGQTISAECYYHGYMGGQNAIVYENACDSYDWGSSVTTPAPAPASQPIASPSPNPAPTPIP
tara:strand:+ start:1297 stop:2331 length:1035 start_codon:yes stop_codon:yes gene_type:complete